MRVRERERERDKEIVSNTMVYVCEGGIERDKS